MSSRAPWGICDRCGFKRRLTELCKDGYQPGLQVCKDTCCDPKPADTKSPRYYPEGLPWPNARPEPEPVFKEDYAIGEGEDL
jgi:hypothetical protein